MQMAAPITVGAGTSLGSATASDATFAISSDAISVTDSAQNFAKGLQALLGPSGGSISEATSSPTGLNDSPAALPASDLQKAGNRFAASKISPLVRSGSAEPPAVVSLESPRSATGSNAPARAKSSKVAYAETASGAASAQPVQHFDLPITAPVDASAPQVTAPAAKESPAHLATATTLETNLAVQHAAFSSLPATLDATKVDAAKVPDAASEPNSALQPDPALTLHGRTLAALSDPSPLPNAPAPALATISAPALQSSNFAHEASPPNPQNPAFPSTPSLNSNSARLNEAAGRSTKSPIARSLSARHQRFRIARSNTARRRDSNAIPGYGTVVFQAHNTFRGFYTVRGKLRRQRHLCSSRQRRGRPADHLDSQRRSSRRSGLSRSRARMGERPSRWNRRRHARRARARIARRSLGAEQPSRGPERLSCRSSWPRCHRNARSARVRKLVTR